jgi:hypothetical protein
MKRDPLGSIAKLGAIYGIGASAYGAIDPTGAESVSKWMRGGFGLYDDPVQGPAQMPKEFGKKMSEERFKQLYPKGLPSMRQPSQGFLERSVKGVGGFFASPFEFGRDLNSWYKGDKSWDQIKKDNFGWLQDTKAVGEAVAGSGLLGKPSSRGGGGSGRNPRSAGEIRRTLRDFTAPAANISAAREAGMYKQGGISQALITGAITPEALAMLGYGSGQVTGSGGQTIDIDDVAKIKTTLRSAV